MYPLHKATSAVSCENRMPANEKRRYVMTSDFRQYIAEYTVANFWDVIQSDIVLHIEGWAQD